MNNLKKPKNDERRDFISLCHQSFLSQKEDEKFFSTEEQKQLEEMIELWKVIFDSEIDDLSQNTSVFHSNVFNRKNVIIMRFCLH